MEARAQPAPVEAPQDDGQIRVVDRVVAPDGRMLFRIQDEHGRRHNVWDARGNQDAIMMFRHQRQRDRERREAVAIGDEFN